MDDKGKETGTFSMSVGGETKSGLSMKKTDGDNYIGNATFNAVTVSDVGTATANPADGTYNLSGGGMPRSPCPTSWAAPPNAPAWVAWKSTTTSPCSSAPISCMATMAPRC